MRAQGVVVFVEVAGAECVGDRAADRRIEQCVSLCQQRRDQAAQHIAAASFAEDIAAEGLDIDFALMDDEGVGAFEDQYQIGIVSSEALRIAEAVRLNLRYGGIRDARGREQRGELFGVGREDEVALFGEDLSENLMIEEIGVDQHRQVVIEQKLREIGVVKLIAQPHADADGRHIVGQGRGAHQLIGDGVGFVFDDGDQPHAEGIGGFRGDDSRTRLFAGDDIEMPEVAFVAVFVVAQGELEIAPLQQPCVALFFVECGGDTQIGADDLSDEIFCDIVVERCFACAHRDGEIGFESDIGDIPFCIDAGRDIACDLVALEGIECLDDTLRASLERFAEPRSKERIDDHIGIVRVVDDIDADLLSPLQLQLRHSRFRTVGEAEGDFVVVSFAHARQCDTVRTVVARSTDDQNRAGFLGDRLSQRHRGMFHQEIFAQAVAVVTFAIECGDFVKERFHVVYFSIASLTGCSAFVVLGDEYTNAD